MNLPEDERFQAFVIDRLVPFPKILEANGYEGYSYEGKCLCIFHDNFDTPAAKMYHDAEGDTIWCFSEQKRYRPSDVYKRKLNRKGSIASVSQALWNQLSSDLQQRLLDSYDKPVDMTPELWKENEATLNLFKAGKIDFIEHVKNIIRFS